MQSGRAGRGRPPQRPDGPVRRRATRKPATPAAGLPDVPEWDEREKLAKEKEVLGFYLSSHPLAEHQETLATYCSHTTVEAAALAAPQRGDAGRHALGDQVRRTPRTPRPGSPTKYAMFDLEDMAGIDAHASSGPSSSPSYGELVQPDAMLVVLRRRSTSGPGSEEANLIVNELIPLDEPGRPLHPGRGRSASSKRRTASAAWRSCTRSSAAIPASASCNC